MKRSEFLRKAILAAIAIPLAPQLLKQTDAPIEYDVVKAISAQLQNNRFKPTGIYLTDCCYLKVDAGLLSDSEGFENFISSNTYTGREIESIFAGWMNDDFLRNEITIELKFKPI